MACMLVDMADTMGGGELMNNHDDQWVLVVVFGLLISSNITRVIIYQARQIYRFSL